MSALTGSFPAMSVDAVVARPQVWDCNQQYNARRLTSPPPPGVSMRLAMCALLSGGLAAIVLVLQAPGGL